MHSGFSQHQVHILLWSWGLHVASLLLAMALQMGRFCWKEIQCQVKEETGEGRRAAAEGGEGGEGGEGRGVFSSWPYSLDALDLNTE